jgi:hypothetical protein
VLPGNRPRRLPAGPTRKRLETRTQDLATAFEEYPDHAAHLRSRGGFECPDPARDPLPRH